MDGAALLAAAVRAACHAKAPRRTTQAVAAAVTGVFARPMADRASTAFRGARRCAGRTRSSSRRGPCRPGGHAAGGAQRARKKARRRETKQAASMTADVLAGSIDSMPRAAEPTTGGAAGCGAEPWGDSAERSAQAPPGPSAGDTPPGAHAEDHSFGQNHSLISRRLQQALCEPRCNLEP